MLDALVARVDTEVVTWSRMVQERELRRMGGAPAPELTPEVVRETLVRRHLLVVEARKLRLEVSAAETLEDVELLARAAGGAAFWERAARLGLDRAQLEERSAQQLLVRRYQELRREMTFVPESEVRAFFLANANPQPQGSLAEMRDVIRTQLAERKYQEELERWIRRQVAEGRVEWLPLPEAPAG
ncbi:MAG: hypothetical protein P1P84_06005 [Deferrisomatales bacterium]|nr:hypothetical protein [Deferrisomatales bacterium]